MECDRMGYHGLLRKEASGRGCIGVKRRAELFLRGGVRGCSPNAGWEGWEECAELEAAVGAGLAGTLPQVSDVGGPGDLMETKAKEITLGRVVAAPKSWED